MPRTATACAVILAAMTGCGTSSKPSGHPAVTVTTTPSHRGAPTYASCEDFSKVFDSRDENQLSYLPDQHWLIVSPTSTAYKIDLINDTPCIAANPDLANFVAQFLSQQENGQRSECRATLHQLKTGAFAAGEKAIDPEALHEYAVSVCQPLGIAVPGR